MIPNGCRDYLRGGRERIDRFLDKVLPPEEEAPALLHRAMRYSALAPGKRLRPLLCLAACRAVGGNEDNALPVAGALELIHVYSLIHDDLPSMDDDDLRRGRPTSHKVFGEGVAILAGDALLSLAFEVVAQDEALSGGQIRQVIAELARAGGSRGMVGGQQVDLEYQGQAVGKTVLDFIHSRKTGALLAAAVRCGGIVGGAGPEAIAALNDYGTAIGLAFQIQDDILDVLGEEEKLGKSPGQDEKAGKATYPALWGLETSRKKLQELLDAALSNIRTLGEEAEPLREIARYIGERDH